MHYADRSTAGRCIARKLSDLRGRDVVVIALSPGAVELGAEVATALHAPLRLLLVGKITHPYDSAYTLGAFTNGRLPVYTYPAMEEIDRYQLDRESAYARTHLRINELLYDPLAKEDLHIEGKTVVLVDDGIASGLTMRVAAMAVSEYLPQEIVAAVTVASAEGLKQVGACVDRVVALEQPYYFPGKLSHYYKDFYEPDIPAVRKIIINANGLNAHTTYPALISEDHYEHTYRS